MRISPFLIFIAGCTTLPTSLKPVDAQIPELKFSYLKDGSFKTAFGHSASHFKEGDPKVFKVKVNQYGGVCKLRYIDGNDDITKDCTGSSEVTLDLGLHYKNQPEVIGISVSQEKLGIQQGFLYSLLRKEREPLPVEFKCPHAESEGDLAICTRPATYAFKVNAVITNNVAGELLQTFVCNDGTKFENIIPVSSSGEKMLEFTPQNATFCTVGLGLRQGKRADGTHSILQAKSIFIRFYDPLYIPLSTPVLKTQDGVKKICPGESYSAYTFNNKDGSAIDTQTCFNYPSVFEFLAWDGIGRFSYKKNQTQELLALTNESWDFYEKIKPWVKKNSPDCVSDNEEYWVHDEYRSKDECMKKEYEKLMHHPQMIKAIENWDSSLLYK
jgi:hypothetical protein